MENVALRGGREGIDLMLSADAPFEEVLFQLRWKFIENKRFFGSGELKVNVKGRNLTEGEKLQVEAVVAEATKSVCTISPISVSDLLGKDESLCVFRYGTIRSGEQVKSNGHIVVFGNVNPASILEARGSIVVLGSMRGVAHAGSGGDREVIVAATDLRPTQIRIADVYTRPPEEEREKVGPEYAFVNNDKIYIELI